MNHLVRYAIAQTSALYTRRVAGQVCMQADASPPSVDREFHQRRSCGGRNTCDDHSPTGNDCKRLDSVSLPLRGEYMSADSCVSVVYGIKTRTNHFNRAAAAAGISFYEHSTACDMTTEWQFFVLETWADPHLLATGSKARGAGAWARRQPSQPSIHD